MNALARPPAALLCFAAAWLATSVVQAGVARLPYQGTWKGSIGPDAVMVCFSPLAAQYYGLQQRRGRWLEANAAAQVDDDALRKSLQTGRLALTEKVRDAGNLELRSLAHWQLEPDAQGGLHGTWRNVEGSKKLVVQLERVPAAAQPGRDEQIACDASFYLPIQEAHPVQAKPKQHQGRTYQELRTPIARSLQLPGNTPGIVAFNAYARQWLGEQAVQDYECTRMGGSTWDSTLEPQFWTDTTIVLRDSTPELYCGGAHGFSSEAYPTWNLETGMPIAVWDWLQGGAKSARPEHNPSGDAIRTPLRALLEKNNPRNDSGDECADESEYMEIAQPHPAPQGLVFDTQYSHAMRACNDSITLSWRQVLPLLTPAGKAAMQHWNRGGR